MKKGWAILLILVLVLSLTACTQNIDTSNTSVTSSDVSDSNFSSDKTNTSSTPTDTDITYFESDISPYAPIELKNENGDVLITASDIAHVYAKYREIDYYSLQLDFTTDGAKKLENATRENIGKKMGIYVDNQLIMEPVVAATITDGQVIISNIASKDELLNLYEKLTTTQVPKDTKLTLPSENTQFTFSSGAGAWISVFTLNENGSFSGNYHDSEMGSFGDDYPNGTAYISVFNGQFTDIEKTSDYSYKMTLNNVQTRDVIGTEWIDEGIRYIAAGAHGLEGGTEFILYLPDTPISELPEDFLFWWPYNNDTPKKDTLSCYGILNVATNNGFFTY